MKQILKRAAAVLLTVLMVISLAATAFAKAENQTFDETTPGTEKLITGYENNGDENGVLELAAQLKGKKRVDEDTFVDINYTFVGVKDNAFDRMNDDVDGEAKTFLESVKELVVEDGIKKIGVQAFANLPELEKVTFKGDAVLGAQAFLNCPKLKTVTFEKNADLGKEVFYGCAKLEKISFGNNVVFREKALDNAENVKDLIFTEGASVSGISNLKNTPYISNYPVDFIMNGSTLLYYKGNDEEVKIPLNVTAIGNGAFADNQQIRTVNISKYVETLGEGAFKNCTNLANVNFATFGSVKTVGSNVFTGTAFYDRFDGDFFTIGTLLIKYRGNDDFVYIPNTVTAIAPDCFMGCYAASDREDDDTKSGYTWVVSSVFVPASVTKLGKNCFALDKLDDGSYYLPKIYAYNNTAAMDALKAQKYDAIAMPALADVDANGAVEAADARLALRLSVHLDLNTTPDKVHAADVDGSGIVTSSDARTILRLVVELEDYKPEDLLTMPMTKTEILMTYANALDMAARYRAGYTMTRSSAVLSSDMCPIAASTFQKTLSTKGADNDTNTYESKSQAAVDHLFISAVISEKDIDSASCTLDGDGKYTIDIKFKDAQDNYGTSSIVKVLPAKNRAFFASDYAGKNWWMGSNKSNSLTKFDLTYHNCATHAVLSRKTNQLDSVKQSIGYFFNLDGRINGLAVSAKMWKTGDATLDRLDEITYDQFVYNAIANDLQ